MTDLAGQPDWAAVIRPHKFTDDSAAVMIHAGKLRQAAAELDRLRATNAALEKERDAGRRKIMGLESLLRLASRVVDAAAARNPDYWVTYAPGENEGELSRSIHRALTPTPAPQERQNG